MILRWLLPLGLLGLLGLVALIIIYIIKPKHKQKVLSSTYVLKRALKINRKKAPINILNNLLIIILQAIVLASAAIILAQPHLFAEDVLLMDSERIIIVDASASMRARFAGSDTADSRFDKAITQIRLDAYDIIYNNDGVVSIIYADNDPHYIVYGANKNNYTEIEEALDAAECSYGEADLEGALLMAQQRLYYNPTAEIYLYTGTEFGSMGSALTVINLANAKYEWNIAILSCDVGVQDNEYVFNITVGAYGDITFQRTMYVDIKGADNGLGVKSNYYLEVPVRFEVSPNSSNHEMVQTIAVRATNPEYGGKEDWFFDTYEEVNIEFKGLNDSISDDDTFKVYGGYKDIINVQYWSAEPNVFWQIGFSTLTQNMRRTRSIDFKEIYEKQEAQSSGYDIYIFEHSLPEEIIEAGLPKDGIIVLSDPDSTLEQFDIGVSLGERVSLPALTNLSTNASHPLLQYLVPTNLGVTQYTKVESDDITFIPILYCGDDPVMFVKNTGDFKIIIMPFSINRSNFFAKELQIFIYNLVNYFMPYTLTDYDYTINESASVNCKGVSITVKSESGATDSLTRFPVDYTFTEVGTYTFSTQFGLEKDNEVRKVYVHIPSSESALFKMSDFRIPLDNGELTGEYGTDIFVYFAAIIVALLLVEWCLQFREIV